VVKPVYRQAGEAFPQRPDRLCFASNFPAKTGQVVAADSLVLRNRQLLVATNRCVQYRLLVIKKTSNFTIMNLIELNIEKIRSLCAKHKVNKLFVFGSVLKDTFNKESDIDLVVDFAGVDLYDYADNYFDLKDQLESIFKRPVDLLEQQAIKNPYLKKQIDSEKKLIYGQ